jgi:hypothetical protein
MKTIKTLDANARYSFLWNQALGIKSAGLRFAVFSAIDSGAVNANDTCDEEGLRAPGASQEAYSARWHEMFLRTLEGVTTWRETPAAARKWFANRGVIG